MSKRARLKFPCDREFSLWILRELTFERLINFPETCLIFWSLLEEGADHSYTFPFLELMLQCHWWCGSCQMWWWQHCRLPWWWPASQVYVHRDIPSMTPRSAHPLSPSTFPIAALPPPVWERSVDGFASIVWEKDSDHMPYSLGAQAEPLSLWYRRCQADKSTLGLVRSIMTFKLFKYSCYKLSTERKEYFYFSLCYILKSFIFTTRISLCVSNMCIQG